LKIENETNFFFLTTANTYIFCNKQAIMLYDFF